MFGVMKLIFKCQMNMLSQCVVESALITGDLQVKSCQIGPNVVTSSELLQVASSYQYK